MLIPGSHEFAWLLAFLMAGELFSGDCVPGVRRWGVPGCTVEGCTRGWYTGVGYTGEYRAGRQGRQGRAGQAGETGAGERRKQA